MSLRLGYIVNSRTTRELHSEVLIKITSPTPHTHTKKRERKKKATVVRDNAVPF